MELGERLYQLRRERRMSQEALADALGVSRQSVSKWENGASTPTWINSSGWGSSSASPWTSW